MSSTEAQSSSQPIPVFYKFRFTFSDQDSDLEYIKDRQFTGRCKTIMRSIINRFSDNSYFYLDKYTAGFETKNKMGELCKAHFHLHFQSLTQRETILKVLRRVAAEFNEEVKTNKSYSLKADGLVRSVDEFYRYPLKQDLTQCSYRGFTQEKIEILHEVAHESWLKACQINSAKQDKRDAPDTLFLTVMRIVEKNNDSTKRAIAKTFYTYYYEENKPINHQVIEGYVVNAMLKRNLITIDQILDQRGY